MPRTQMDVVKVGHDWSLSGDFWIKSVFLLCLVCEANSISSHLFSTPAFAFVEIQPLHQKDPCGSALTMDSCFLGGLGGDTKYP